MCQANRKRPVSKYGVFARKYTHKPSWIFPRELPADRECKLTRAEQMDYKKVKIKDRHKAVHTRVPHGQAVGEVERQGESEDEAPILQ